MQVLIPTQIEDYHALAVQLGLEQLGHRADRWFGTDFPQRQTAAFELSNAGGCAWRVNAEDLTLGEHRYDSVWYRRPNAPVLPDWLHADDVVFTRRENNEFYKGIWNCIERDAFWVNAPGSYTRASNKIVQLQLAIDCGLTIPDSLISNDPKRIKGFLDKYSDTGVIYKPFLTGTWFMEDGSYARIPTTVVEAGDLPEDEVLQATPGIFQSRISKSYELRITFFGAHYEAARLTPKGDVELVDWREASHSELSLGHHELPDAVYRQCRMLMKKLGIVFGCFDFIVDRNGGYIFLEVNEMGQFLFIEEVDDSFNLLDIFCQFIISGNPDFSYQPSRSAERLYLQDISSSNEFDRRDRLDRDMHIARKGPPKGKA